MYIEVEMKLDGGGTQVVPLKANAATRIRYRAVFGKDPDADLAEGMKGMSAEALKAAAKAAAKLEGGWAGVSINDLDSETLQSLAGVSAAPASDAASKLAYIMHNQAAGSDMTALNYDKYAEWLERFEPMEFVAHSQEIFAYMGNKAMAVQPKKAGARQSGP